MIDSTPPAPDAGTARVHPADEPAWLVDRRRREADLGPTAGLARLVALLEAAHAERGV